MSSAIDLFVKQAQRIGEKYPELHELADLYAAFVPIVSASIVRVGDLGMTRERVAEKLARGIPVLQDEALEFDAKSYADLVARLAQAVEELGSEPSIVHKALPFFGETRDKSQRAQRSPSEDEKRRGGHARRIRELVEKGKLDSSHLIACASTMDTNRLADVADEYAVDEGLLWTLCHHALLRGYAAVRAQVDLMVDGVEWQHDYCYVCGADALLGELQGDQAEKHLRCGQCGADWVIPRLDCVHCGNNDQTSLSFLYAEGERETRRVQVCDRCHGYIKLIASYAPVPPEILPILDLATVELDYIAVGRAYQRNRPTRNKASDFDPRLSAF